MHLTDYMHDHEHGHIPPPDAPRKRHLLGLKPLHVILGALFLVVLLLVYLLLMARPGV